MSPAIHDWLARFKLDAALHDCACQVLAALPDEVRQDFVGDPAFHLCDYEPSPFTSSPTSSRTRTCATTAGSTEKTPSAQPTRSRNSGDSRVRRAGEANNG
jgi:hypothetical protein